MRPVSAEQSAPERAPSPATRPLRADAARNQQRILDAARDLFAERGFDITLDQVAEHAGVGVGTVYRRFANKLELLHGVLDRNVENLADRAESAARHPDPWQGLVEFCDYACADLAENRALGEVLLSLHADLSDRFGSVLERVKPAADQLVRRAKQAGGLRPDAEIGDLFALLHMVGGFADFARPVEPNAWRRYLAIMLDGLHADGGARGPLPGRGLTDAEIEKAKSACHARRR